MPVGKLFLIAMGIIAATVSPSQDPAFDLQFAAPKITAPTTTPVASAATNPFASNVAVHGDDNQTANDDAEKAKKRATEAKLEAERARARAEKAASESDGETMVIDEDCQTATKSAELAKDLAEQAQKIQKEFGPQFQKQMQKTFGPQFQLEIEKAFGPEFQMEMKNGLSPEIEKRINSKIKKIMEQFGPSFEKRMELQFKNFNPSPQPNARKRIPIKVKTTANAPHSETITREVQVKDDDENNGFTMPPIEPMTSMPPMPPMPPVSSVMGSQKTYIDRVIRSLTSVQKNIMRQRGYLKRSDLSITQRGWLGMPSTGNYSLSYQSGANKIIMRGQ